MTPDDLRPESFTAYPPEGRRVATSELELLRTLPLPLLPALLRELIDFDWRFPPEQREVTTQLRLLRGMTAMERAEFVTPFRELSLPATLSELDWVRDPQGYLEQLTATLWSTHTMPAYRAAAEGYAQRMRALTPERKPGQPRWCVVVIGQGAAELPEPLFRKLRPHGVLLDRVRPEGGLGMLLAAAERRAQTGDVADGQYLHWYVDGGTALPAGAAAGTARDAAAPGELAVGGSAAGLSGARGPQAGTHWTSGHRADEIAGAAPALHGAGLLRLSYSDLEPARRLLLQRAQVAMAAPKSGPEELRSLFARLGPRELGMGAPGSDPVVERFALSLLTEGSGTQIYATTFAQWGARECLRRAQPETLLVRYAPRQRQQGMDELLRGAASAGQDAAGSLVDGDMGAYYTWINLGRLSGADEGRFLVWWEDHALAVAIGPGLPRGTQSSSAMRMDGVLKLLG